MGDQPAELTFCVVGTAQRELLSRCLDAIARERATLPFASRGARPGQRLPRWLGRGRPRASGGRRDDRAGSAGARRSTTPSCWPRAWPLRAAAERGLRAAPGRHDRPLASPAGAPSGGCRRGRSCSPRRRPQACAWRFPTPLSALAGALSCSGCWPCRAAAWRSREVDWCQSSALLVRREAAAQVGYLDPDFFVYSDEVDFARRLRDAGWLSLYVPEAVAIHHEQLSTGAVARAADRGTGTQPGPLHAKASLSGRRPRGALADGLDLRVRALGACVLRGHRPGATGATPAPRCARPRRGAARGRRTRTTRGAVGPTGRGWPQRSRSGSSA